MKWISRLAVVMVMKGIFKQIAAAVFATAAFAAHAQVTLEYIHTDALGSPVAVTDVNQNVVERSEYEPYGQLANRPMGDGPGYAGQVGDAATGLNYVQQRYYDAQLGIFLSVDPIAASTNPAGQLHRYRYADSNPYRFTDPDGRRACPTGTRVCFEARSTKVGPPQPAITREQNQKDNHVAQAQKQSKLSDGTRLDLSKEEQSFTANTEGTAPGVDEVHGCMTCNGKQVHTMSFGVRKGDSPGHTHGQGIEQVPGRDDASRAAKTGQTAYMISKSNAFAIEHTPDGYRVRVISGPSLDRGQIMDLERKIESWNKFQGTGGGSCTSGC